MSQKRHDKRAAKAARKAERSNERLALYLAGAGTRASVHFAKRSVLCAEQKAKQAAATAQAVETRAANAAVAAQGGADVVAARELAVLAQRAQHGDSKARAALQAHAAWLASTRTLATLASTVGREHAAYLIAEPAARAAALAWYRARAAALASSSPTGEQPTLGHLRPAWAPDPGTWHRAGGSSGAHWAARPHAR